MFFCLHVIRSEINKDWREISVCVFQFVCRVYTTSSRNIRNCETMNGHWTIANGKLAVPIDDKRQPVTENTWENCFDCACGAAAVSCQRMWFIDDSLLPVLNLFCHFRCSRYYVAHTILRFGQRPIAQNHFDWTFDNTWCFELLLGWTSCAISTSNSVSMSKFTFKKSEHFKSESGHS